MEQQNRAILTTELSQQISACVFSRDDLRKLCDILQESCHEAAKDEVSHYAPLDKSDEQIILDKLLLQSGFVLKVTVQGIDDQRVYGTISDVFNSPRFPDKVKSLYIESAQYLRDVHNWIPRNRFELFLDFTKPELFNLSLSPSISTPNASNVFVTGLNSDWVNGVFHKVTDFIEKRKTRFRFIHRHSIYDLLVPCGCFPFAFSIASKFAGIINNWFTGLLESAAYLYVFYISLITFRILFDYARWVFPVVEYKGTGDPAQKHRSFLYVLLLAVLGNFIYDVVKIVATFFQ